MGPGVATAVAVLAIAALSAAEAEVPPRDEPVPAPVAFKTEPFVQPVSDANTLNMAPPLPPQLEESHPLRFPTSQFPSDPPVHVPRRGANNDPSESENDTPRPPGRWLHTLVSYKNKLALFGGVANSASLLNDLWIYDYTEANWIELESASAPRQDADKGTSRPNPAVQAQMRPPDIPPPPPMARAPGVPKAKPATGEGGVDPEAQELKSVALPAMPSVPPSGVYAKPLLDEAETSASFLQLSEAEVASLPSDLWVYDMASRKWSNEPTTGPQPPARWLHTAVAAEDSGLMVVYGGISNNMLLLDDVWTFSFTGHEWTEVTVEEGATKPDPREGHAAVATDGKGAMMVFGGVSYSYEPLGDMWKFSLSGTTGTWTKVEVDTAPPPRWMHTMMATGPDSVLVFGGCSSGFAPLNDLWSLSGQTWTKIDAANGYPPTARWLHSAAALDTAEGPVLVVHGGAANNMYFDDMWAFYVDDQSWVEMYPSSDSPVAREGHKLVFVGEQSATGGSKGGSKGKGATRRRLLSLLRGAQASLAPGDAAGAGGATEPTQGEGSEIPDSQLPAPFRANPPTPELEEVRGESRKRKVTEPTAMLALFGGASERGLVASKQEEYQTVS